MVVSVLILFLPSFFVFAQNELEKKDSYIIPAEIPKNVLIELFINKGCSVCPKAAFCLEEIVWGYEPGKVILVESHIWGDGFDTPETNARYNWYAGDGPKGTPDAFLDGMADRMQGLCCDCGDIDENISAYQEIIEKHLSKTTPIKITAKQEIYGDKIIIEGEVANKSHSMLNNLFLSGIIYFEGDESEFFYLTKYIFENQDICQLAPLENRKFSFVADLELNKLEKIEQQKYRGVVFVQDKLSKEVLQSFLIP